MSSKTQNKQQKQNKSSRKKNNANSRSNNTVSASSFVSVPLSKAIKTRTTRPNIRNSNSGDGRVRVTHREFMTNINNATTFTPGQLSINPGLPTFPWLSQTVAFGYESYRFISLRFYFETSKSASTNGSVMMAIDYDAADNVPVTKQDMLSYHGAVKGPVWSELVLQCDAADLLKFGTQRFIRHGVLAPNLDIKTYDIGNLIFATSNGDDANFIGELYCEYTIELMTPQLSVATILNTVIAKVSSGGGGITQLNPFGTAPTIEGGLPCRVTNSTINIDRVGQYLLAITVVGTALNSGLPAYTGVATVTTIPALTYVGNVGTMNTYLIMVVITTPGNSLTFNFTPMSATITSCIVRITPWLIGLA